MLISAQRLHLDFILHPFPLPHANSIKAIVRLDQKHLAMAGALIDDIRNLIEDTFGETPLCAFKDQ
ncbi:MAG: hypothetical protein IT553_05060 [Sphingomonadaceae bacterium]|nr:hypothetical protein [Sphingomonadaceae bacterium]